MPPATHRVGRSTRSSPTLGRYARRRASERRLADSSAVARDPGSEAEALARAHALSDLGRHQEALDVATRALAAYTDSSPFLVAAGRATIAVGGRGSRRAGLELLRRALAVDPDDVDALSVLGVALMHTVSHGDEGERLLDRAVELAPDDPGAAYSRALALEHRSIVRYDKAHAAVLRALELAPHDPEVRLLKAKVDLGRVGWVDGSGRAEVADDLRVILADDLENAEAAYPLARTEVKTNRAEVAHDFHRVVRIDPRHGDANAQVDSVLVGPLGQAYWWLGCSWRSRRCSCGAGPTGLRRRRWQRRRRGQRGP